MRIYFDDKCPLCCKTRKFIERYIKPLETTYVPLSKCELPSDVIDLALNDLYITDGEKTWLGYSSYIKLLSIATVYPYKPIFKIASYLMRLRIIKPVGKKVYRIIADNRKTCSRRGCQIK